VFAICAWLSILVVGAWRIKFKDHGHPPSWALFQIVVALVAMVAEITGLLQEPN
jgi:hypothetical protein